MPPSQSTSGLRPASASRAAAAPSGSIITTSYSHPYHHSSHSHSLSQSHQYTHPSLPSIENEAANGAEVDAGPAPEPELEEAPDPNSLSPRRSSIEIERMGDIARQSLIDRANEDQQRLAKAAQKLLAVKDLVHRLEQRNASLRSHIDEVMKSTNLAQAKPKPSKGGKSSRPFK